ncbi:MAG: type I-C CRISPR-associated protein Cas5c [Deltaproteobacteria bacterium]|nr:type I-C CRISPR-associated protein Cas5c [Deltaproteobacteria bacterium]
MSSEGHGYSGSVRLSMRVRGELACFTRPEFKVERMSYEIVTPSAARSLFECVLWKPQFSWEICEIAQLAPVAWASFRRNEVNSRLTGRAEHYCADEDRAQRNTVALRDVDYVITATLALTEQRTNDCNVQKYCTMFAERMARGQFHRAPYLGCREFAARIDEAPESFACPDAKFGVHRSLGQMFYDFAWPVREGSGKHEASPKPLFFEAKLASGVLVVPPRSQVLARNL